MGEQTEGRDTGHLPTERVVAFVDILGFRSVVGRMVSDPALYHAVRRALETIPQEQKGWEQNDLYWGTNSRSLLPQQAHFSDSVVFSDSVERAGPATAASRIVDSAADFAGLLLLDGLLVRGGIARGWAFHEGNVLFGAGVVAAYDLESQVSRVPRIVIADDVAALLDSLDQRRLLRLDSDGFWFINPLATRWYSDEVKEYQRLGARLKEWLKFAAEDFGALAKYRWLALLFNSVVAEKGTQQPFDSVEPVGID